MERPVENTFCSLILKNLEIILNRDIILVSPNNIDAFENRKYKIITKKSRRVVKRRKCLILRSKIQPLVNFTNYMFNIIRPCEVNCQDNPQVFECVYTFKVKIKYRYGHGGNNRNRKEQKKLFP